MMKNKWIRITLCGWLVLLLTACNAENTPTLLEDEPAMPASPPTVANTQTEPEMAPSTPPPGMEALIEQAREDLAKRFSIAQTEITLVEARTVVWPDSSLGCPQPGMRYKQIPEDGALIVLEVGGKKYEYHTGGNRGLFLCEMIYKDPSTPPKIDITTLTPPTGDDPLTPPSPDNSIPPGEDQ